LVLLLLAASVLGTGCVATRIGTAEPAMAPAMSTRPAALAQECRNNWTPAIW
jgi:hypothetical protein